MSLKRAQNAFRFVTQMNLTQATGLQVRGLRELLQYLKTVPAAVIHHHTHHFLKKHQYLSPEPPNDFAYWVSNVLREERLGEQLASIDTVRFSSLRALREKLVAVVENYLSRTPSPHVALEGDQLYLLKSVSFILPTPYAVWDLQEFQNALHKVSLDSLYHHMFEARIRLGKEVNDFSAWLDAELGEQALAQWIKGLDPYTQTLEGLRNRISYRIDQRLKALVPESVHAS